MSTSTLPVPLIVPVDAEHNGKRTAGCAIMLVGFLVPLIVIGVLINDGWFIGVFVGLVVAAMAATVTERVLRHRWPSGRTVRIDPEQIAIVKRGQPEMAVDPHQDIEPLLYHFVTKRSTRIRKGWHVLVLAIEHDDILLPLYSFASPEQFAELEDNALFRKLEKPDEEEIRKAGMVRRMLTAEHARNLYGAEMTLDQFTAVVDRLQELFPQWMPRS